MKKKEDKKKDLESLRQDLARLNNLFVTGYEKLKVSQDFELRKVVRGAEIGRASCRERVFGYV